MNKVYEKMIERIENNQDPITGEKIQTVGQIFVKNGKACDTTGKEVILNDKGTWIYK
ncbi:MAG: hypothetical protein PVI88_00155 [Nitrosopumilaceae archaeon]|jgi:hypothetical protein